MATLRKLQLYFFVFITVYMVSGIGALIMGMLWLQQSDDGAPREAVISREIEKGALVAATSFVGYIGGISPVRRKSFLVAFAWLMLAAMIAELALGGVIWFKTLRMRSLFATQWLTWPSSLKTAFQDMGMVNVVDIATKKT
ncbi:hypothetical protein BGZ51_003232 [Haplosporangium sp. Z 767]|nr:hypothetical protein BGZ51_003232 [Haplosporangium sp. Z 767]KAF9187965.1 hypothetical protein BGZ50_001654 [Haplosporangium sp. Z 11]